MFTSITKELLGTKIAQCNEIISICQALIIDDEYKSINITSQKELRSISGNINLNHTRYIPIYQLLNKLWTSLSLTQ